jgi:ComF family protein
MEGALFPDVCAACGDWIPPGGQRLCRPCDGEIAAASAMSYCRRCGRSMPASALHDRGCVRCRTEPFWNVHSVTRVGAYEGALQRMILALKYAGRQHAALVAAERLAAALQRSGRASGVDLLIPVPMHWLRRLQRPIEHAQVLTEALGQLLRVEVYPAARRIRPAPSQTRRSSRAARFENVRNSFGLRRAAARKLGGRHVCIVDNVVVSGATLHELAKVLRRGGARVISAATIARATMAGDPQAQEANAAAREASAQLPPGTG